MKRLFHINIYKAAGFWGVVYLFLSIHPFPMWIIPKSILYFLAIASNYFVFIGLYKNKQLNITKYTLVLFVTIIIYIFYTATPFIGHKFDLGFFLRFMPFLLIVFYPLKSHYYIFEWFRKLIIFFSAFGIIVFLLLLTGIELPYYKVDGFTEPMQTGNHYYRIFGFVVSSTNTVYRVFGLNIARVCGPFLEPGHFAIYIGITLSIEKLVYNKLSRLPIVAGFLTFSPAFLAILFLIIIYDVILKRNFRLLLSISTLLILLFSVILVDSTTRNLVYYLAIGRNFSSIEQAALDERTSRQALAAYSNFTKTSSIYTGKGIEWVNEKYGILSDYRGFIFRLGIIGFGLSILIILILLFKANIKIWFLFFPIAVLIHAHRYWMFLGPYIYLLFLVGVNSWIYFYVLDGEITKRNRKS